MAASIAATFQQYDKDAKIRAEQYQLLQKENVKVSDSELKLIVDKMASTTSKNRKKNPALQDELDLKDGYDGAFPREEFYIMKEIIETESSKRQGTIPTICFALKDEYFFDSKETACSELESSLESAEPTCELASRLPALIQKNILKNFLRADRFLTLLAASNEKTSSAVKCWLFKVACSAGCGDKDLSDLGNAAFLAIQKIGHSPSSTLDSLESLLDCWLAKPSDSSSSSGKNITGLCNVLVLAAKFCSFDASSKHDFDRILTQIMYIGLDEATTTGFRAPINNLVEPIIDTIARKQGDGFDRWCKSWSNQFARDLCSSNARNH